MEFKYTAFISYSNKNIREASRLKRQLQRFSLPSFMASEKEIKHPLIFMADKDFNEHRVLSGLHKKLDESEYLIVVCSPDSAKSPYCEEEISYFIRTGRADRIIPYIISGHANSGNPETECYPKPLRELPDDEQISGVFIPTVGTYKGYLMTVSRILNIEYDSIKVIEGQRRKRTYAILAACILALAGIGAKAALYYLPQYQYYADYVDRNGLPEGVIRLDKDARRHRPMHYTFEYRKNKLVKLTLENSYGYPTNHGNTETVDRPCIKEFQYNDRGGIEVICKDASGRVLWVETISPNRLFVGLRDYDTDFGAPVMRSLSDISSNVGSQMVGFSFQSIRKAATSTICGYALERDNDGYITKKMFSSSSDNINHPGHDSNGIEGVAYELDSLHRVAIITYLNKDGIPVNDHNGVSSKHYYYDRNGNITRTDCVDKDGKPSRNENFWASAEEEFNEYGQWVRQRAYDDYGRLTMDQFGVALRTYKWNDRGLVTEVASFDDNESPVNTLPNMENVPIAHRLSFKYNKDGLMSEMRLYDTDDELIKMGDMAYYSFEYDNNRNITRQVCRDEKGEITYGPNATAYVTLKYADNLPVEMAFYDTKGRRANSADGYSYIVRQFTKGRLVREEYFNKFGARVRVQPLNYACGVAIEYDKQTGNVSKVSFLGEKGTPDRNAQGQEIVTSIFNSQGLCSEERNQTANGELIYLIRHEYDEKGNPSKDSYYDETETLALNPETGYASIEYRFNGIGQVIEQRCYDADNVLALNNKGWAIARLGYNKGQPYPSQVSYYDTNDLPIISEQDGYHQCKIQTERGQVTEIAYFGTDDKPMLNKQIGAWKQKNIYSPLGLPVSSTYLDQNDQRMNGFDGFCETQFEYDSRGWVTVIRSLDADSKLKNSISTGYACQENDYLYNGLQSKVAFYNEDHNPTDGNVGYHSIELFYDSHFNIYMQECRNAKGELAWNPQWNCMRMEYAFNDNDECIYEALYLDAWDGTYARWVILDTLGYPKIAFQNSLGDLLFSNDGVQSFELDNINTRDCNELIEERIRQVKKHYAAEEGIQYNFW